jgi:hypothetical protein
MEMPWIRVKRMTREEAVAKYTPNPDTSDEPITVTLPLTPAYASNLTWTPDHMGLKTIKIDDNDLVTIVTAMGGMQLVCTACEAPFTIDQWLMRVWRDNGDLFHEECDDPYRTGRAET